MTPKKQTVETPSGKGAGDENFPVGSHLLPARLRPHVSRFYAFARAADDIADHSGLAADEKIRRLDLFEDGLTGRGGAGARGSDLAKAELIAISLEETGVTPRHCVDLLAAFKQDAVKNRYADWDELMGYCRYSAAPVGRYLLALHGESPAAWPASDALCASLQVLNHLQDCQADLAQLDRVYLPLAAFAEAGAEVDDLAATRSSPALRRVLDRCLDGCERLNREADALVGLIRDRRLRMEAAVIVAIAHRLAARRRRGDPLAGRVALSATDR
ncbi:MAG: squalene synthase HpnC, partial [Alphaproteobacteria bacterium]|nr:squalene synthase HpnC [Alphaproteobacteria bacterium]